MLKWTSGGSLDIAERSRDSDIIKVKDVCSSAFHTFDQHPSSCLIKELNIMESNLSRMDDCTPKQDKADFKHTRRIDRDMHLLKIDRSMPPSPQDTGLREGQDVNVNLRKSGLFTKFKNIFKRSSSKGPSTKSAPNSPTAFGSVHRIDGNQLRDLEDGRTPPNSLKCRKSRLERLIDANRDNRRHKERPHETQTKVNSPLSELNGNDEYRSNFISQANNKQLLPQHNDISNINAFQSERELIRDQQNEKHKTVIARHVAQIDKQSAILENRAQDIRESKRKRFTANSTSTKSDTCILPSMLQETALKASFTKVNTSLNHKIYNRFYETTDNRSDLSPLKTDNASLRSAIIGRSPKSDSIYFRQWLEKVKQIDPFTLHTAKRSLNKLNVSDRKFTWSCSKDGRLIVFPSPKQKRSYTILPKRNRPSYDQKMPTRNNNNGHRPLHRRKDIDILAAGSFQSSTSSTVDKLKEKPPTKTRYPKNEILLSRSQTGKVNHNQDTDDSSRVKRIVHSLEEKMSSETLYSLPTALSASNSSKPSKSLSTKDIAVAECKLIMKNERLNNTEESCSPDHSTSSKDDSFLRSQTSEFSHSRGFEIKMSQPVNNTNDVNAVSISTAEDEPVLHNIDENGEINNKIFDIKEQISSATYTDKSMTQSESESPSSIAIISHTPNQNIEATPISFESFLQVELQRNEPSGADLPSILSSESLCENHLLENFTEKSESPVFFPCENNDNEMLHQRNELTLSTSDLQNEDPADNEAGQSSTAVHNRSNDLIQVSKIKNREITDEESIKTTTEIRSFMKITELSQKSLNDLGHLKNFETKEQTTSVVDNENGCLEAITSIHDENTQGKVNSDEKIIECMTTVDEENVKNLHSGSMPSATHNLLQTDVYSNQFGDLNDSVNECNDLTYRDQRNPIINSHVNQTTDCKDNQMTNCQGNPMIDNQSIENTDFQVNQMTGYQCNKKTDCHGNQMTYCNGNENIDSQGNQMIDCHSNKKTDCQGNHTVDCQDNQMTSRQNNQMKNHQDNQMTNRLDNQMINCLNNQVTNRLDNQIINRYDNRIKNQQNKQMTNRLDNQMTDRLDNQMTNRQDNQMTNCQDNLMENRQDNLMENHQGSQMTYRLDSQMTSRQDNQMKNHQDKQMENDHDNKITNRKDNQKTNSQGNQTIDYQGSQTITSQNGNKIDCQMTEKYLKQDDAILIDSNTLQKTTELDKYLKQTQINEKTVDISSSERTLLRNCEVTADEFPNRNKPEIIDDLLPSQLSTSSVDKAIIGLSFSSSDISSFKEDHFIDISICASDSLCNMSFFSKEYDTDLCAFHASTMSPAHFSHISKARSESSVDNAKNGQVLELLSPKDNPDAYDNLTSEKNDPNINGDDRFVLDGQELMDIKQKIGKEECKEQEGSGTKEYTKQNVNAYKHVTNEEDAEFHVINNSELSNCYESVKTNDSTGHILKLATATQLDYAVEHQFDEEDFLPLSSPEKYRSSSAINVNEWDLEVHENGYKKKSDSRSKFESFDQKNASVRSCYTSRAKGQASKRKGYSVRTLTNNVASKGNYSTHSIEGTGSMIYDGQDSDIYCVSNDSKPMQETVSPWICESSCTTPYEKIHFHEGSSKDEANVTSVKLYNKSSDLDPFLALDRQPCSNKSTFGDDVWEKTAFTDFSASFISDVSGDGSGDCSEPCEITKMNMSEKFLQMLQQPVCSKSESPVTESCHLSLLKTKNERQFLKLRHQRQIGHKSVKKTKNMTSKSPRMNLKKSVNSGDERKLLNHIDFRLMGGHQSGKTYNLSEDKTTEAIDDKLCEVNDKLKNGYDQDKESRGSTQGEKNKPKQWFFLATMLFFQLLIHWLHAR